MIRFRKKPRVLLLDDDASMQRLISRLLRGEGFRVDCVSTGRQAIERIHRADYAALLLDIMTPTEGGMTVIEHLRENDPTLLKRVVLVTGSPPSMLRRASKDVFAVVKKPFEPRQLVEMVRNVTS